MKHERVHHNNASNQYSFYEIITANKTNESMYSLKQRCLKPGLYYMHLTQWFAEFSKEQIFLIDSELFKQKPYMYLNKLQPFFGLKKFIDYTHKLILHKNKYCLILGKSVRCLGAGKNRNYPKVDENSIKFLEEYYREPNEKLKDLLLNFGYDLPEWLEKGDLRYGLK